jgi:hypothetical protein
MGLNRIETVTFSSLDDPPSDSFPKLSEANRFKLPGVEGADMIQNQ